MHAHRVDVLDGADDDAVVRLVADDLHLVLLPAQDALLDQHLGGGRQVEAAFDDLPEFLDIVGDAPAGAGQGEGRADDGGQANEGQALHGLFQIMGGLGLRAFQPELVHGVAELLAVLGLVDHLGPGADHLDAVAGQDAAALKGQGGVQRGLPAHGRKEGVRALCGNDLLDHFRGDGLDIGRVRHVRVGHDGGGVRVDQDDPVALGPQGLARLDAGVVELAGLADHDWPSTDDQDRGDIGAFGHGDTRAQDQRARLRAPAGRIEG